MDNVSIEQQSSMCSLMKVILPDPMVFNLKKCFGTHIVSRQ